MVAVQYWSLVVTVMEAARTELVATCTGQELLRFLDLQSPVKRLDHR